METSSAARKFDLNLIRVLDAVVNAGNASKASRRLNLTPAAVSLALRRLQHTYNEVLFIRTKEGLVPTMRAREIHHTFNQILELVDTTFDSTAWRKLNKEIVICGSDIIEQCFLSELIEFDAFEQFLINHRTNWSRDAKTCRELLLSGEADLAITFDPPSGNEFTQVPIENFSHYSVVCSEHNPLSELEKLSLHHFYSFPHAVIHNGASSPALIEEENRQLFTGPYSGRRLIGYRGESINGLLSIVERSSMIAVIPQRLAHFFQLQRNYAISLIPLPDEIIIKPLVLCAVWSQQNKFKKDIPSIISMLQSVAH
ncbi:LysR family transcriptional regulator [Scandinavium sp. M-37]|jgi:DNA-binding transcriptional LysR family regulator|uniref:LysR family transcriptional regulator n=1 Tax=Scandinavium sp. M-37 TaxID=3373077 RepID=UPI0037473C75